MKISTDYSIKGIKKNDSFYTCVKLKNEITTRKKDERPVFLVILLDKSGSMSTYCHNKTGKTKTCIEYAKESAVNLLDCVRDNDLVSLITFSSNVNLVFEPTRVDENNINNLKKEISKVFTNGCTNISGAIELAQSMVTKDISKKYNCKFLLLSDGCPNKGLTKVSEFENLALKISDNNISISSLGFGDDYDLDIMETISGNSGGNFYHVSDPELIFEYFNEELNAAKNTFAKNIKLVVSVNNGYKIENNLNKYLQKQENNKTIISIGNLSRDKSVIFEVKNLGNDYDCVLTIKIFQENEEIYSQLEVIKSLSQEELDKIEENEELLGQIVSLLKMNYLRSSSINYSSNKPENIVLTASSYQDALGEISNKYSKSKLYCDETTAFINNMTNQYISSALSEEENRALYTTSCNTIRN